MRMDGDSCVLLDLRRSIVFLKQQKITYERLSGLLKVKIRIKRKLLYMLSIY